MSLAESAAEFTPMQISGSTGSFIREEIVLKKFERANEVLRNGNQSNPNVENSDSIQPDNEDPNVIKKELSGAQG